MNRVEQLGAHAHVVFGGRVPAEPHGPLERATVQRTPPEYPDRRDWEEIRAWAAGIATELRSPGARLSAPARKTDPQHGHGPTQEDTAEHPGATHRCDAHARLRQPAEIEQVGAHEGPDRARDVGERGRRGPGGGERHASRWHRARAPACDPQSGDQPVMRIRSR